MPLDTYTREELLDLLRAEIRGLHDGADLSELSDYDIEALILTSLFFGNQAQALHISKQIHAKNADATSIIDHLEARGKRLLPAQAATLKVIVTSQTAAAAATAPAGTILVDAAGNKYETLASATTALPGGWPAVVTGHGSNGRRVILSPNTTGIVDDDTFRGPFGFGGNPEIFAVKGQPTSIPAVDTYRRLRKSNAPANGIIETIWGAVVEVRAQEVGSQGNLPEWETLSWETKPDANFDDDIIVIEGGGGGDIETTEEARERCVVHDAGRPGQGNPGAYVDWCTAFSESRIGRAFVFPNFVALNVITIVAEGASGARQLPTTVLAELEDYLEELAPAADILDLRTTNYSADVDVDLTVLPKVGFEPDWGPTIDEPSITAAFAVAATGSTNSNIRLTADASVVIEQGDRVLIQTQVGSRKKTTMVTVTTVTGGGTPSIDVSPALENTPLALSPVLPGSPLAEGVLEAIETLFDNLGPGVSSGNVEIRRFPLTSTQGDDTIRLADLYHAIMGVTGVEDVTINTPSADQLPTYINTLRIGDLFIRYETT